MIYSNKVRFGVLIGQYCGKYLSDISVMFSLFCNSLLLVGPGTEVELPVLGLRAWELAVAFALMTLETFVSYH